MISTQRLLMIVIAMNMVIGFAMEIYYQPQNLNEEIITVETQLMEQYEGEFESNEGVWGSIKSTATRLYESTIGSPIRWGWTILKIFIRAINPFAFTPSDFVHPVEQGLARFLVFFRSLLITIVIIEGYMFFKSNKVN